MSSLLKDTPLLQKILLPIILCLAFFLRLWGVPFGLPHLYHADEPIIVNHALAYSNGDLNPHFFRIPPLTSYLLFVIYGIYFVIGKIFGLFTSTQQFEYLFYEDPSSFYICGRFLFGALLGTFSVYMIYQIVRKNFSSRSALISSILLFSSFLHVRDSHYLYCDILLLLALITAFGMLWKIIDAPQNNSLHFMFGSLTGICCAIKYNGGSMLLPYFFILFQISKNKLHAGLKMLSGLVIFYLILNPFSLIDYRFFINELVLESHSHGGIPWTHHYFYSLKEGLGLPLWIFGTFSVVYSLFTKNLKILSLVFFVLSYYIIIILGGQPYERYVLPIIPFILILSAVTLNGLVERLNKNKFATFFVFAFILTFPGLMSSIRFDKLMNEKDTRTLAKTWIEENIPSGKVVALDHDFFGPRLNPSLEQLKLKKEVAQHKGMGAAKVKKIDYLINKITKDKLPNYSLFFLRTQPEPKENATFLGPFMPFDLEKLREQVDFVIMTYSYAESQNPHRDFHRSLSEKAIRITSFSPYKDSRLYPIDKFGMTGGPFSASELKARKCNGYAIEIYQLKQSA